MSHKRYHHDTTAIFTWQDFENPKISNGKSKSLPQQAEVAQGIPGRLRPWIFLTFWHYKGGRSAKHTGHLYPRRNPWYSLSEAELTSGAHGSVGGTMEKSPVTPLGIDPGTVRLEAQRLSHYATPGPKYKMVRT